jgi:hypothetical protein
VHNCTILLYEILSNILKDINKIYYSLLSRVYLVFYTDYFYLRKHGTPVVSLNYMDTLKLDATKLSSFQECIDNHLAAMKHKTNQISKTVHDEEKKYETKIT